MCPPLACLQIQAIPWLPTSPSWRLVVMNDLTLHPPNSLSLGRSPVLIWNRGEARGEAARTAKSEQELRKKLDLG